MEDNAVQEMKLWVREESAQSPRRLICTIGSSSKFRTMPWSTKLNNYTDEDLIRAAKDQRDGWKFNGPWPHGVFEIEAFDYHGNEVVI